MFICSAFYQSFFRISTKVYPPFSSNCDGLHTDSVTFVGRKSAIFPFVLGYLETIVILIEHTVTFLFTSACGSSDDPHWNPSTTIRVLGIIRSCSERYVQK